MKNYLNIHTYKRAIDDLRSGYANRIYMTQLKSDIVISLLNLKD